MRQPDRSSEDSKNLLGRVLSLSFRISQSSPPMKPFIRFSHETNELYRTANLKNKSLFWDFDNALQKVLLNIVKAISTPDQIVHGCIERWKSNLELLYQRSQRQLDELVKNKKLYQFFDTDRIRFVSANFNKGNRFLYIGCGQGTECLSLANRGLNVIGIDTYSLLTKVANAWASYLDLSFKAICMDVMELGFKQETFDGLIIEFYGYLPLLNQSYILQENLARVLRKGAHGFIVGMRKHYSSFWFLMRQVYPPSMASWLASQVLLDYHWDNRDGHEEKLLYGLYFKSHTIDSLSNELGHAFNVIECQYEKKDPRYVICKVERKENVDSLTEGKDNEDWGMNVSSFPDSGVVSIPEILEQIETICNFLESHEKNVSQYFEKDPQKGKGPIQNIPVETLNFIQLLEPVLRCLPDYDGTCSSTLSGSDPPNQRK